MPKARVINNAVKKAIFFGISNNQAKRITGPVPI